MPELINLQYEFPDHVKALLNIVAFLIAASCVWYAYFIKGKDSVKTYKPTILPELNYIDGRVIRKIGEELERIANVVEEIHKLLQVSYMEEEIARRASMEVERRLTTRKRSKTK